MSSNNVEFNLAKDVYASFDAITLKEYIKERLTENSLFTDQNFEGSNLSALTDIFAFTYHILLFYLNQTSSEAMFDQAQLYENINKLVKLIGYNPEGPKTSILSFNATGNSGAFRKKDPVYFRRRKRTTDKNEGRKDRIHS